MTVRASWLLHWSIRQLGKEKQYFAVVDLLLERRSGQLAALLLEKGAVPIKALENCSGSSAIVSQPVEQLLDSSISLMDKRYTTAKGFLGKTLFDDQHRRMGLIGDLQFAWPSGEMVAIEISQGLLTDLIFGREHLIRKNAASLQGEESLTGKVEGVE